MTHRAASASKVPRKFAMFFALLSSGVSATSLYATPSTTVTHFADELVTSAEVTPSPALQEGSAPRPSTDASGASRRMRTEAVPMQAALAAQARASLEQEQAQPEPMLVVVPDFKTLRVSAARRLARDLELKLVVRDTYGDPISAEEGSAYRIRKQDLSSGTTVNPGTRIKVRARAIATYSDGY
jgi:hypothetical protein